MGDFADMALSETMDMEDERFLYRMGGMSDLKAYDAGIIDERGGYIAARIYTPFKTCRHCGASGLKWKSTDGGWRLHAGADLHNCAAYMPAR